MDEIQGQANEQNVDSGVGNPPTASKSTQEKQTSKRKVRRVPTVDLPLGHEKSKHPSERLPVWAKPIPGEDIRKYAERLGLAIHLDSMERSLRGDTAAHAKWREQAMKGLGLGQRSELDITAKSDDWTRNLTDEELRSLITLQRKAQERQATPQIGSATDNSQALGNYADVNVHMLGSDNSDYVKSGRVEGQDSPVSDRQATKDGGGGPDAP